MLHSYRNVKGMTIGATDGEIGKVIDLYLDDQNWAVRYVIVNTGSWLAGRKVLVSPRSIAAADWDHARIDVSLTREQVRNSPDIDTEKPVSRQHETAYHDYYNYPYYWTEPHIWGPMPVSAGTEIPPMEPAEMETAERELRERQRREQGTADCHLRSANAVMGYHIEATDDSIGHIEDFMVEPEKWLVRYLVIDTRNWLPGKHVLVAVDWVKRVSWSDRAVYVDLSRAAIRESPEYDREAALVGDYEARVYRQSQNNPAP